MTFSWRLVAIGIWLALCVYVPGALVMRMSARPGAGTSPATPGAANRAEKPLQLAPEPDRDDPPQRLDLRGNEIARPVASYRVDRQGTLYEVHSPDTEVPRLKAPKL